jgi:hypothetical protein
VEIIQSIIHQIGEPLDEKMFSCLSCTEKNLKTLTKNKQYICLIGAITIRELLLMLDTNPTAKYLLFADGPQRPFLDCIRGIYVKTKMEIIYGQTIEDYMTINKYHHFIDLCYINGSGTTANHVSKLCCQQGFIVSNTGYLKFGELIPYEDKSIFPSKLQAIYRNHYCETMDYIGKIIYINLDKRIDRKHEICREFAKMGVPSDKFERFPAQLTNPGTNGCGYSHFQVLRTAINCGYKNVLVLEDDFEFLVSRPELDYLLDYLFTQFKEPWDVIMFTYALDEGADYDHIFGKVVSAHNAGGYLVNQHYLQKLSYTIEQANIKLRETGEHWLYANDSCWIDLQRKDNWFYFKQQIGHQRTTVSDTGFWPESNS